MWLCVSVSGGFCFISILDWLGKDLEFLFPEKYSFVKEYSWFPWVSLTSSWCSELRHIFQFFFFQLTCVDFYLIWSSSSSSSSSSYYYYYYYYYYCNYYYYYYYSQHGWSKVKAFSYFKAHMLLTYFNSDGSPWHNTRLLSNVFVFQKWFRWCFKKKKRWEELLPRIYIERLTWNPILFGFNIWILSFN